MEGVRAKVRRLELTNERSPLWAWEPTAPFTVLTVSGDTIEFPPYSVPARSVQSAVAYSVKLPGLGRIPWTIALRLRTQDGIYDLLVDAKVFVPSISRSPYGTTRLRCFPFILIEQSKSCFWLSQPQLLSFYYTPDVLVEEWGWESGLES